MLKLFFRPFGLRTFSDSRVLRTAEKDKNVIKATETPEYIRPPGLPTDFVPSEYEKVILVLSGKFKSKASIPPRIGLDTFENAKSRFRIRGANFLMVCTLFLCGYYVWKGKKMAREGETITKMYIDMEKKIVQDEKERLKKLS